MLGQLDGIRSAGSNGESHAWQSDGERRERHRAGRHSKPVDLHLHGIGGDLHLHLCASTSSPSPRESSVEGRHNGVVPSVGPVVAGRAMSVLRRCRAVLRSALDAGTKPRVQEVIKHAHLSIPSSFHTSTHLHKDPKATNFDLKMTIPTREFGKTGEKVGCIGYGAMGLAAFYGEPVDQPTVNEVLSRCLEDGATFWDTSDVYSPMSSGKLGYNEGQIGEFFRTHPGSREKVFLCTKFIINLKDGKMELNGSREWCHQACSDSLARLGVDQIDLYYAHRPDPNTPVTTTVAAMKELKDAGKIRYIGVSEYNLEQLKAANEVVHIDALQIELSPWTPDVLTNGILDWCVRNNTALVAYSPLGRGFLTGQYKSVEDFEENDFRRYNPRFTGDNFAKNLELVDDIRKIASRKNATPGQIALAWLLQKSDAIIPIPGTKKEKYLIENNKAANVTLDKSEVDEIDAIINSFKVSGTRYGPEMMATVAF
ncbi:hypothetical protein PaG_03627 [Moesziomyces aphidis]|uniref:NADP-dependent oxidoreductase domain-containing protein n=1 Tax=Moesziomyces aphidis TaxID=84754 RepID=W3VKJ0_MOEAP|nr:hypothetical protein PaG_03627 [Moesziomyces aphidis]